MVLPGGGDGMAWIGRIGYVRIEFDTPVLPDGGGRLLNVVIVYHWVMFSCLVVRLSMGYWYSGITRRAGRFLVLAFSLFRPPFRQLIHHLQRNIVISPIIQPGIS